MLLFAASTWSTKSSIELFNNAFAVCQQGRKTCARDLINRTSSHSQDTGVNEAGDFDLATRSTGTHSNQKSDGNLAPLPVDGNHKHLGRSSTCVSAHFRKQFTLLS